MEGFTPAGERIASSARNGAPPDPRQQYTALLADLATILREHPRIPAPYIDPRSVRFNIFGADAREVITEACRAIRAARWDKKPYEYDGNAYYVLTGEWHGIRVELVTAREAVCRRIVVGTEPRPVEKVITPAVVKVVMEPAEIAEWRCEPLLADRSADERASTEAVPAGSAA